MLKKIDFLIIGAQKSGTTSLFHYLRMHPEIFMPSMKEIAYFSDDLKFRKGFEWYLNYYFGSAKYNQIKGEASPQYMAALESPKRIRAYLPGVRLIAILRNPIDRAFSGYSMMVRKKIESKSFAEIIDVQKKHIIYDSEDMLSKKCVIADTDYLQLGMYGAILDHYLKYFKRDQIKIVFTEDLKASPEKIVKGLLKFVGASDQILPSNIGKKYHQGGKLRYQVIQDIMNSSFYQQKLQPVKRFVPKRFKGMGYWVQQWNVIPQRSEIDDVGLREEMSQIFKKDVEFLEDRFKVRVPWQEFITSRETAVL